MFKIVTEMKESIDQNNISHHQQLHSFASLVNLILFCLQWMKRYN